jgi:glyoxylase-like metal-dependent hydrolase (beta-lactamase superfamily II)
MRIILFFTWASACLFHSLVMAGGVVESSYQGARNIIKGSLYNQGSTQWLDAPVPILVEASGTLFQGAEHQGRSPDDPTPAPFTETWAYDPASGAVGLEYRQKRPDGTEEWIRELYLAEDEQLLVFMDSRSAIRLTGPQFTLSRDRKLRRFPPLLLKEVLRAPEALRLIGRYGSLDGVQAQTRSGESLSLFFGRDSGMLGWVEYLRDLPTFSDSSISWKFFDYREVAGVGQLPHRYAILINKRHFTDMEVVRTSTRTDEVLSFLRIPQDISVARTIAIDSERNAAANASVVEVAPGVHWLRNLRTGFHTLFVEFDTYLLAVEAPAGYPLLSELPAGDVAPGPSESWLSERYLEIMRETVPEKPLRYLALSHFHNDHAGGLYAFAAKGVHLLAAESEVEAIEGFLGANHTLCDREPAGADAFRIEAVDRRRIITDGNRTVELLDMGNNPHTDHLLLTWLPEEKVLYVADLLTPGDGGLDSGHSMMNDALLAWLDRQQLKPDVIITSHGSGRFDPNAHLPDASAAGSGQ